MKWAKAGLLGCLLIFSGALGARSDTHYQQALRTYQQMQKEYDELSKAVRALPPRATLPNVQNGRLTVTSGTPVTTADVTNATTLYFTPYLGNLISVYWRSGWRLLRFTEVSLSLAALGLANASIYDVFGYRDASTNLALELSAAWASTTTRTDALALQDGIYVKASDPTRRYLGTFRTNTAAVQVTDSIAGRHLWNYYNRVVRNLRALDATNSWSYNNNNWRQAGGDAANQGTFVLGINEVLVRARVKTNVISNNNTTRAFSVGIGLDTTTANSALLMGARGNATGQTAMQAWAEYLGYPGIGFHTLAWIETCPAGANVTSWGDNGAAVRTRSGIKILVDG